eukprot:SAG11_NODE_23948_length_380_cov_1.288256_1_plen_52_part_10
MSGGLDGVICEFSATGAQTVQQMFASNGESRNTVPIPVLCIELLESFKMMAV